MESNLRSSSVTAALFFALLFLSNVNAVTAILAGEFDSMLNALRVRGYELFSNAIVTSDLLFDVMIKENEDDSTDNTSFQSFTFFAPTDSSLFALDMTQSASVYTDTLRYHVVPRRLSVTELRLLSVGYSVQTLLPGRYLNITRVLGSDAIAVGGVDIAFPGLFYGRDVAVHGLAGILNFRSNTPQLADGPSCSSSQQSVRPRIGMISSNTAPVASVPANGTILAPAPELNAVNSHSPAVSLVVSGYSPASSTEPPVHSHISGPAAPTALTPIHVSPENGHSPIYLPPTEPPVHSHISAPMSPTGSTQTSASPDYSAPYLPPTETTVRSYISAPAAPTALTPTPASQEYRHSAIYLPPTEPPVRSQISAPMSPMGSTPTSASPDYSAPYLPPTESSVHSYISAPAAPTALTAIPASPEYSHSATSSPPIGFSNGASLPLGLDAGHPKKDRVLLMETFTAGYKGEIRTVRFADEVPETPPPLAEKKEMAEESEPFEGIVGCATPDVALGFADSTSRDLFQRLQCHYA